MKFKMISKLQEGQTVLLLTQKEKGWPTDFDFENEMNIVFSG